MSASSLSRNVCFTTGRTVTYPASSSVKRIAMVSGSGMPNECSEFSAQFRKTFTHTVTQHSAVNRLAFQRRLGAFHHRAHLLDQIRAGFSNRLGDGRIHLRLA